MAVTVDDVKNVLYLDGNDDDVLIQSYISAANQFVKSAIGDDDDFYKLATVQPLFDSAVRALAATYYQYRLSISDTQAFAINLTVNSIIGQLRGRYTDYKEGKSDAGTDQQAQSSN